MIKAVGFRVIVRPDKVEEKTQSGIVLAVDKKIEKGARVTGTVVDIGPDAFKAYKPSWVMDYDWQPWCEVGDKVYFARYAGKMIVDPDNEEEDYVVLNDEDIVAKYV